MADKITVEKAVEDYKKNREKFIYLTSEVEKIIKEVLNDKEIEYHNIEKRTKSIESFKRKAKREKYKDPINEITDLAGIRIVTLFEKDVYKISTIIKEIFKIDYENSVDKSDFLEADKMGYKSVHYIAALTDKRITDSKLESFKDFYFEIQIRSILQHAWAEIEHDRNYKFKGNLPKHLQRRFYSLAGMLEMADREFNQLAKEVEEYKSRVKDITKDGEIELELTLNSLKKYSLNKFNEAINSSLISVDFDNETILKELKIYGINNLIELDDIVPENFCEFIKKILNKKRIVKLSPLIRTMMIINDHHKYFEIVCDNNELNPDNFYLRLLKEYDITINKII
ncbi:GTP pyrophosphokinase [Halanaerobium hydrogeniformans]|uniref:RelA/SpoT domain protein n=1 Tax=Halanaerobium hydrogeniformans TaxID=656519 RepID=E4RK67_HALHG|nr:RelA/SpoT domain-containing protein [Halanaerobium hydrogeniformans]ADQ14619.1 RelA/SpoT domain protein [Halanaerobium hydrogeniformans]